MSDKNVHPISKKTLESHLSKVDMKMESIDRGMRSERSNLFELFKDIGGDKHTTPQDVMDMITVLRNGFCLYYEIYGELEMAASRADGSVSQQERQLFLGSYATFAASSYIMNELASKLDGKTPMKVDIKDFPMDTRKDEVVNSILTRYYGIISNGKLQDAIESGKDLPAASIEFFTKLAAAAESKKDKIPRELFDLMANTEFKVGDDFSICGYEATKPVEQTASSAEFARVYPNEVVGNVKAKRKVIRYIDRLCLYDSKEQMNPFVILGGLSWTNLWDGLPGTGKTTMMRMAMTRLADRASQIGIPFAIHTIDQSVKNEYYGKTAQNALAILSATKDPARLHLTIFDDIDLLTAGTRQDSGGGADNDLRNVIMQYLDGAFTIKRGNNQVYAASNDPKGLDPAVRNRFNDRLVIDGPTSAEDFADQAYLLLTDLKENGLLDLTLGYEPLATQDSLVNGRWTRTTEAASAIDVSDLGDISEATLLDFGRYMFELKKQNPSITGRSAKAIIEAAKERAADFDVPEEFFTDRSLYLDRPFAEKLKIIKSMFKPITIDVLFEEAKRYYESEARYTKNEREGAIEKNYNARVWGIEAEIKMLEGKPELLVQLQDAKNRLNQAYTERDTLTEKISRR